MRDSRNTANIIVALNEHPVASLDLELSCGDSASGKSRATMVGSALQQWNIPELLAIVARKRRRGLEDRKKTIDIMSTKGQPDTILFPFSPKKTYKQRTSGDLKKNRTRPPWHLNFLFLFLPHTSSGS